MKFVHEKAQRYAMRRQDGAGSVLQLNVNNLYISSWTNCQDHAPRAEHRRSYASVTNVVFIFSSWIFYYHHKGWQQKWAQTLSA